MTRDEWLAEFARQLDVQPPTEQEVEHLLNLAGVGALPPRRAAAPPAGPTPYTPSVPSGLPGPAAPAEPVVFMKATTAICGPNDDIVIPRGSEKTDWEVELGVVIGAEAKYVTEDKALDYVAGYCVVHDLSERAWQLEGTGQWVKGKSADTFAPIGPWLVTRDEAGDPQKLDLFLEVDGKRRQTGSTAKMIFPAAFLVSYLSRYMRLMPGDIISTGTPPGVGHGQKPPVYLRPGQIVRLGVSGLGEQRQRTVAE